MTFALCFAICLLLWVVNWFTYKNPVGGNILTFLMFLLLGWAVFGAPIHH